MGFTKLEFRIQYGELGPLVSKFLGMGNIGGGFFPKVDEKHGDGDREYNWWGCSKPPMQAPSSFFKKNVFDF